MRRRASWQYVRILFSDGEFRYFLDGQKIAILQCVSGVTTGGACGAIAGKCTA